ncbi:MAG: molybdopterin-dependent oxidoreductase [Deinococcota bacterium]|nr:molybdopterin-dependent oxidoreductase [Deinococcota bacterium]
MASQPLQPASSRSAPNLRAWGPPLLATVVMLLVMLGARLFAAAPLPPEMLFNYTAQFLGVPWVFNLIHALPYGVDAYAKYALFVTTTVVFGLLWLALGRLYPALSRRLGRLGAGLFYVLFSVLLTGLVLMPLQGLGVFGLSPFNFFYQPLASLLWSAVFGAVFALVLHLAQARPQRTDESRRESVRTIAGAVFALAFFGTLGKDFLTALARAQDAVSEFVARIRGMPEEVTSVREHYQVSKNVFNPSVPEEGWQLRITGLVENELTFTLDELRALPSVERTSTLMCVSNQVGGNLIGNSSWTGVPLSELLAMAGVGPGVEKLILRAADNYADSFPLSSAFHEGVILAYLHNGEPLTRDHGFPARLLIPEIYGMKNVKWLQEIELSPEAGFLGYWQQRGWSDSAIVKTMSRIDTPEATRFDDGSAAIGGVAWAGTRGVSRVEVSLDGGVTWQEAQVKPALNDISWNLWGYRWNAEPGQVEVMVRATDGAGETQTAQRTPPLPDGASGYHGLRVRVA